MGYRGGTRKVLGIISLIFGLVVLGASGWLLSVAMNDSGCQGYDRTRGGYEPYYGGGYGSNGNYGGSGYRRGGYDSYGNIDRFSSLGRRRWDGNNEGGARSREWTCEFIIDNWITAAWITICVGIFQAALSFCFVIASWGDNAYTAPRIWTILWSVCHVIFLVAAIAAIVISTSAEIFTSYLTRSFLGALYVGVMGTDAAICFIFPVLAYFLVMRKLSDDDVESYDERPNSRTEFIKQQQMQQERARSPMKVTRA